VRESGFVQVFERRQKRDSQHTLPLAGVQKAPRHCAVDGGMFTRSYACVGAVSAVVPVDLHIHGCPPAPIDILKGLLALLDHAAI
jgi:Ni,Fe-hydrogenase III small subunit